MPLHDYEDFILSSIWSHGYTSDFLRAMFLKLSRRQRAAKIASVATLWQRPWFCRKKFNSLNFLRFFSATFSSVASHVRGWLHMRFSPCAGDATIFQKIASPSQAKNRSCSCGLRIVDRYLPLSFIPIFYHLFSEDFLRSRTWTLG